MKPTIFITVGLPASGKTYFTERLAKEYGIFFLNCDLLRLAMFTQPTFKPYEHAIVFGAANFIVEQHAHQGKSIICNANFNFRKNRKHAQHVAMRNGLDFRIIWVQTPIDVLTERIQSREHDIPAEKMVDAPLDILTKQQRNLQLPGKDEPVIAIDGTVPYNEQLKQFKQQLDTIAN